MLGLIGTINLQVYDITNINIILNYIDILIHREYANCPGQLKDTGIGIIKHIKGDKYKLV